VGRRTAGLILAVACVAMAGAALADLAGSWRYHDLWCFYHGGEAVLRGIDPYDRPAWSILTDDPARVVGSRIIKTPCPSAFAYPYWTAIAFAPLALFPYDVAAGIWGAALAAGLIGGLALLARVTGSTPLLFAVTLGSLPAVQVLAFGQVTAVLFPLLGVAAVGTGVRAGVAAAMLSLKPQLAGLFAPAMALRALGRADRTVMFGALATLSAVTVASLAVFPLWPIEWWRETTTFRLEVAGALPGAWGLSHLSFGSAWPGAVLAVGLATAVWLLCRGREVGANAFAAIAISLSLFTVPHIWTYDQLFLALPWAVVLAAAARADLWGRRLLLGALVAIAVVVPWAIFVATFESGSDTLNGVIPALAALLVAATCPRSATMDP